MVSSVFYICFNYVVLIITILIGSTNGRSGLHSEQSAPPSRVQQCREGCLEKFATEDFACLQGPECSMCWDQCAAPSKINTSIKDTWALRTISMIRQESLVSADIAWPPLNAPSQCLVTWEIAGGGLMGNLLTDSYNVQLSLWPETKYRVQVTCKNKQTEVISRSLPLTLDTSRAIVLQVSSSSSSSTSNPTLYSTENNMIDPNIGLDMSTFKRTEHNNLSLNQKQTIILTDLRIWSIDERRKEVLLGVCAAIIVFLCILAVFILNLKRTRQNSKENILNNENRTNFRPPTVFVY